jgi:hypothetical protein
MADAILISSPDGAECPQDKRQTAVGQGRSLPTELNTLHPDISLEQFWPRSEPGTSRVKVTRTERLQLVASCASRVADQMMGRQLMMGCRSAPYGENRIAGLLALSAVRNSR